MPTWLALGIGLWIFSVAAAIALCRAAARGEQPDRDEPSPLAREIQEWLAARERTFHRQSIQELPPAGHHRIGIDHPKRGAARLTPPTP